MSFPSTSVKEKKTLDLYFKIENSLLILKWLGAYNFKPDFQTVRGQCNIGILLFSFSIEFSVSFPVATTVATG